MRTLSLNNMKYFTKYLPVEGDINHDDFYFSYKDGLRYKWLRTQTRKEGDKLAKLFLCSRDIQVGDEIISSNGFKKKMESTDEIDRYMTLLSSQEVGKVIGKVSENAIWVKEGVEFEKDDLFLNGLGQNWNNSTPLQQKHIVKIKCPTCKQFH